MRSKFSCLGCFGFMVALFIAPFILVPLWNNWQLLQLQNNISALKHPNNSRFVARYGEIANFGNGNHLDYWAVEIRSFSGSPSVLKQTYKGVRVPVPNTGEPEYYELVNGAQPVELLSLPSPSNFTMKLSYSKWNLSRFAGQKNLYAIRILNGGEDSSWATLFDWRGN